MNKKNKIIRLYLITAIIIFASIFFDLLSKILIEGKDFTVIPNLLDFTSIHNSGAAYGIFSNNTLMLIILSIIMLILLIVFFIF